jgi:hypothetical protein
MSHENVEIVKRGIDAFNDRDVDLLATLVTPDFAWFPALPGVVEGDGYRGREGIEMYFEEISNTWAELRVIGGEFRDLGDGGSCSVEPRDVVEAVASRSIRRLASSMTFATARCRAFSPISITARRCGRWASPTGGQVPVSGGPVTPSFGAKTVAPSRHAHRCRKGDGRAGPTMRGEPCTRTGVATSEPAPVANACGGTLPVMTSGSGE